MIQLIARMVSETATVLKTSESTPLLVFMALVTLGLGIGMIIGWILDEVR